MNRRSFSAVSVRETLSNSIRPPTGSHPTIRERARRSLIAVLALVVLGVILTPTTAKASHNEPTAPIKDITIKLSDTDTGQAFNCDAVQNIPHGTIRSLHIEGFIDVTSVPSEHWQTRLHVMRGNTGSTGQWSLNPSNHQNIGSHMVGIDDVKFVDSHNHEMAVFPPQTWTVQLTAIGDMSRKTITKTCTIRTVASGAGLVPTGPLHAQAPASEVLDDVRLVSHTEPTSPIDSLSVRAGPYPGLNKRPFKCDGTDVTTDNNLRIEPIVHATNVPSEHWTETIQFFRFGKLVWDVSWGQQNLGNHKTVGKNMESAQANNYDFTQFPDGQYSVTVQVVGMMSGNTYIKSCPFQFRRAGGTAPIASVDVDGGALNPNFIVVGMLLLAGVGLFMFGRRQGGQKHNK